MAVESKTNLNWAEGPLRDKLQEYERWIRTLDYQVRTLEQERQKLSAIVNHTDAGFLALDRDLRVVWANAIFIERFGAAGPPAPLTGAACHRVLCGREAPCAECPASKPLECGITSREFLLQPSSAVSHQEMNLERAGQTRQIYATAMPIRSPEGSVEQVILMLQDITDLQVLRRSREALQQSETQLRAVLDTVGEGVITIDTASTIVMVNQEVEKIWGYRPEEIIGKSLTLLMPEPYRKQHAAGLQRYLASGEARVLEKRLELEGLRKDGSVFPLEVYIKETRIGNRLLFTAALRDITERKRVYNDLRQSESKFRALAETTSAGIFIFQGTQMRYVNAAAERIVGHSRDALLQMNFWEVIHPDFRERVKSRGLARQKGENVPSRYEVKLLTKSGEEGWVDFTASRIEFEGNPAVLGTAVDISGRKRAEEAQKLAEERYRSIFENALEGIFVSTPEGRILAVNPAFARMLGYESPEELTDLVRDVSRQLYVHPQRREELLQELKEKKEARGFESELLRRDGSRIWISANVRAVAGADGRPQRLEGVVQDITEQKQLADQLRQAQKIEAVGQLAGGVAHDFNNLLTAITGYTDFVLEQVEPESQLKGDVEEIKKATERAAALTRQLLAFSRQQMMQPVVLNLNVLVNGMEGMLRRLIGENIELVTVCAPDLAPVKADPHQLEQVILNLVVNARDAMPEGGRLTIETASAELDDAFVQKHVGAQPGACVQLAVSDTGAGMDAEVQKHLFEPFFTTKEKGKGTGLGLSTVYGIVKQSGGYISVYSEPGHGSCFKVYLPQAAQPVLKQPAQTVPAKTAGGTETILLVEDEEAVRGLAAKVLRAKGYAVLEAGDGQEAQAVLKEHKGALDLLLTDVVMPRMGGPELAKSLRGLHRRLKVLFMTGYTDHSAFREGTLPPGTGLIQKPFSPQALAQKVREILDGTKSVMLPSEKTEKQKKSAGQK